ncbi:MAG TPA: hypothetical protein VIV08_06090 [Acidimicrobiia bacterium]
MRMRIALTFLIGTAVLAGCSGDDGDTTTTAGDGSVAPITTLAGGENGATGTTVAGGATSTTMDLGDPVIPEWEVVSRSDGADGSTLVVLLDPESYQSLTDIDLQNVIADVVDTEEEDVLVIHVVDDPEVAEYVEKQNPTQQQQNQLDIHYLARLEDGFRIVFLGPFSDTAPVVLGS